MKFRNILLKLGLFDLNSKRMQQLVHTSDHRMIRWAYDNGKYNIRLMAVEYFAKTNLHDSIPFLLKAMEDKTEIISQTAVSGLERLSDSAEILKECANKRQFWMDENNYREGRRNRVHHKSSALSESKERGSKKTLDNVRNMLKKPMIGGKWF